MLKKTGIIVATAAAGVLGLSSLAFATTEHHADPSDVNYSNVEKGNVGNDCEFGQDGGNVDQELTGGNSGLLGLGNAVTGVVAPITAQTQALNCNNINVTDVVDLDSNNTTDTRTSTAIEDSNNTTGAED